MPRRALRRLPELAGCALRWVTGPGLPEPRLIALSPGESVKSAGPRRRTLRRRESRLRGSTLRLAVPLRSALRGTETGWRSVWLAESGVMRLARWRDLRLTGGRNGRSRRRTAESGWRRAGAGLAEPGSRSAWAMLAEPRRGSAWSERGLAESGWRRAWARLCETRSWSPVPRRRLTEPGWRTGPAESRWSDSRATVAGLWDVRPAHRPLVAGVGPDQAGLRCATACFADIGASRIGGVW